jgi:predicted aconitase
MKLDAWETAALAGDKGPVLQKAMETLVALGEANGAERMIPITGAHLAGCSVVLGETGISFIKQAAASGLRFAVPATTNTYAMDRVRWRELGVSPEEAQAQEEFARAFETLGARPTFTCTPFLAGNTPRLGEHVAWGEYSAVCYINSVLGARTNREGPQTSWASALTGRTPLYGMHLDEERRGKVLVEVEAPLSNFHDYGDLGRYVGALLGPIVPVFTGVPRGATTEELTALAGVMAIATTASMFHIVGVTPEAPTVEQAFGGREPERVVKVTTAELKAARQKLQRASGDDVDWVLLGCPHVTLAQLKQIAGLLEGRHVKSDVVLWVLVSQAVGDSREAASCVRVIEEAGGKVWRDFCPLTTFARLYTGYSSLTTDSARMAEMLAVRLDKGIGVPPPRYGTTEQCVSAAITGRWAGIDKR